MATENVAKTETTKMETKDEAGFPFTLSVFSFLFYMFLIFFKWIIEQMIIQIHKKLTDAFEVFDGDKTKTVDIKFVFV